MLADQGSKLFHDHPVGWKTSLRGLSRSIYKRLAARMNPCPFKTGSLRPLLVTGHGVRDKYPRLDGDRKPSPTVSPSLIARASESIQYETKSTAPSYSRHVILRTSSQTLALTMGFPGSMLCRKAFTDDTWQLLWPVQARVCAAAGNSVKGTSG